MESPLSPAVDKMKALAAIMIETDMSGLQDWNTLTLADEPCKFQANGKRAKKPGEPVGYEDMEEDTGPLVKCM